MYQTDDGFHREKRNDEIASVCKVLSESEEEIAEQKAEQEARQENEGREFSENQEMCIRDRIYPVSLHNLKIKNGISPTPLNCALNALIFALNDSANAFVSLLTK